MCVHESPAHCLGLPPPLGFRTQGSELDAAGEGREHASAAGLPAPPRLLPQKSGATIQLWKVCQRPPAPGKAAPKPTLGAPLPCPLLTCTCCDSFLHVPCPLFKRHGS